MQVQKLVDYLSCYEKSKFMLDETKIERDSSNSSSHGGATVSISLRLISSGNLIYLLTS